VLLSEFVHVAIPPMETFYSRIGSSELQSTLDLGAHKGLIIRRSPISTRTRQFTSH